MQVSVEPVEGLQRRMSVELPAEEIQAEVDQRLRKLARTARLDGFRPGKVPLKVLRQRFGKQVRSEVFGEQVEASFYKAVSQESLRPAGEPSIEPQIDPKAGRWAYVATFEVLPEIVLKPLGEVTFERPQAEVTESDVDKMLERLRRQRQTWEPVDRPAREGDKVILDFQGTMDGETFEGGSAEGAEVVLGAGRMIDGFEAGLMGASAGEARSLDLRFPEDYGAAHLAGRDVHFEVQVREVQGPVLPEVDAEFVRDYGVESGDLNDLRAEVRRNMERELKDRIQARVKKQALDALLSAHPLDVPQALVDQEIEALRSQARQRMGAGSQMELPAELFTEEARKRVALGLLVAEVVKANGIEVDQALLEERLNSLASSYEDPDEVVAYYRNNREALASVENVVLEDQVVSWILEQGRVIERPMSFDEVTEGHD